MKRLSWYLMRDWVLLILLPGLTQAGVIAPELRQVTETGKDVDVIIRFHDKINTRGFPGRGKGRGLQLASLIHALKEQAEISQVEAVSSLQRGGAKRLVKLWSINGLAATVNFDLLDELAALPPGQWISRLYSHITAIVVRRPVMVLFSLKSSLPV